MFDLRPLAERDWVKAKRTVVGVAAFLLFFALFGLYGVLDALFVARDPLRLAGACIPLGVGLSMLPVWLLFSRETIEVRVRGDGVCWKPSWGLPSVSRWSQPGLKFQVADWRFNKFQDTVNDPSTISAKAAGLFTKRLTPLCLDSIVSSAQRAGMAIRIETVQPGLASERRMLTFARPG